MVTAYPVARKQKSYDICRAFAEGCRGVVTSGGESLREGAAFFYGVDESNLKIWEAAKARGNFYYCDNSYFDTARQEYFRVTFDRLQHSGIGESDCRRFDALDIGIKDWREGGKHIVLCPQSDFFMQKVIGYPGSWLSGAQSALAESTSRTMRLRLWSPDKKALSATLDQDLEGAHMLATFSSAAAISAILGGVPAYCSSSCAALPMTNPMGLLDVEELARPSYGARLKWAGVLADNQWTLAEMRSGLAWAMLSATPA